MKVKDRKLYGIVFAAAALSLASFLWWSTRTGRSQEVEVPGATFTVTSSADSGAGTLRQAITDANAAPGTDTIAFSIGTGPVSIQHSSSLPDITGPVTIDGTTQPGFSGVPLIEVQGFGIKVTGGGSTLRSLAVVGGPGVVLETGGGNTVIGCRLTGLTDGVLISNSSDNVIGGTTAAAANNIGSNSYGVRINGSSATNNVVTGNYIGLFSDGTDGRNTNVGVAVENAPNNSIGGTTAGERNVISNNGGGSTNPANLFRGNVLITGAGAIGNVVQGNYIGTNIAGTADGAFGTNGNRHNGVRIEDASNNTVGGTTGTTPGGACTGACNLISGNKTNGGVYITGGGATGNMVLGNFIGTNAAGSAVISHPRGVTVTDGAANNTIGSGTAAGRNVISGTLGGLDNTHGGITLDGNFNTVQGNYVGSDTTGSIVLANAPNGILITGTDNIVGTAAGTTYGGACTGGCNLIVPSGGPGIRILGTTNPVGRNTIDYNYIGLNAAGTDALLGVNFPGAIWIVDSDQNLIGRLPDAKLEPSSVYAEVPQAIHCIQEQEGLVYFEFSDVTGEYTWKNCVTGATFQGIGQLITTPGKVFIRTPDRASALVNVIAGTGVATVPADLGPFEKKFTFSNGETGNGCACPMVGQQAIVSGTYLRGSQGSSDNTIARNLSNKTTRDLASDVTPGSSFAFNNDRGSDNIFEGNDVSSKESAVIIANGTKNLWSAPKMIRLTSHVEFRGSGTVPGEGLVLDLNNNGMLDPNDPGDADGGANNGQNWPSTGFIRKNTLFDWEVGGTINTNPNTTLLITLYGEGTSFSGVSQDLFQTHAIIPLAVEPIVVTTDQNGNATFNIPTALGLEFFDRIRATATVVTPAERNGDTSEFSPPAAIPQPPFDFDGDGKTDIAVIRPSAANAPSYWYVLHSSDASVRIQQFGLGDDRFAGGDFQGDLRADYTVWRSSNGTWYNSQLIGDPATNFDAVQWGVPTDVPVVGDFLDLGEDQQAIFRASEGNWYIRNPLNNTAVVINFGLPTDKLVPADYNGDGRTDPAIYRDGLWAINPCIGCNAQFFQFGTSGDIPVAADYDGDGIDDIAVWRPSEGIWYLNQSAAGFTAFQWGSAGDVPVNGDFDGDGKNDIAIWRPLTGVWWILKSSGGFSALQWGQNGDMPVPRFQNSP